MERRWGGRGGGWVRCLGNLRGNGLGDFHGRGRCRRRGWKEGGGRGDPGRGVRTGVGAVHLADLLLKALELRPVDVKDPFEVTAHFSFHLVDFFKRVKVLADDAPGFIRVRIVADDL